MSKSIGKQPKFESTIARIDKFYSVMQRVKKYNPCAVKRYMEEFSISASYNSNAIEGNTFTYNETRLLIKEGATAGKRSFREHEEIVGYKKGFDFLLDCKKESKIIDEDFIKQVHNYVYRGELSAGKYREEQVYIGDMFNVTFTPCSPDAVPKSMAAYVANIQADLQEILTEAQKNKAFTWNRLFHTLADHHIEFERIHPFIDGNGRTGRLLLIYEMLLLDLLPLDIRYEERKTYYSAFKKYDSKSQYSSNPDSKTEKMAQLLADSELRSMEAWNKMFEPYIKKLNDNQ